MRSHQLGIGLKLGFDNYTKPVINGIDWGLQGYTYYLKRDWEYAGFKEVSVYTNMSCEQMNI